MTKPLGLLAAALLGLGFAKTSVAAETTPAGQDWPPVASAAIDHWRSLRFGMFIHWGPVSLTGREIGWSRGAQTPVEAYDNLYQQFNPTNFNADEWVSTAKAAGMKYIVLTTKHHDGFCLWDTKLTDYNIMHTPFQRDVVKELAAACKKQGIEFGAYYSVTDWYNTNWPVTSPAGKVKREKSNLDAYEKYLQGQITELIKNYGPLITIWNDVPAMYGQRGAETIKMVRQLQPNILINNRTGDGGDYDTPEQKIGKFQMDRPWESCMTVSAHNHWAWGGTNDGVKSAAACLEMLIRGAGGDGNILLNVGPRPDGAIDPAQANLLKDIGSWLAKYGESIYGTRGGPWEPTAAIASTRKGHTIYIHVMKSQDGQIELPAIPAKIKSASLLGGGKVAASQKSGKLVVIIPKPSLDPLDTVVKLQLDRPALDIPAQPIEPATESPAQREIRMGWWREARFGMFIHYGPVALTGREISWSRANSNTNCPNKGPTPVAVYDNLYQQFNPSNFNAADWSRVAKAAGMKYVVLTAKHCDGFLLWDSKVDGYNISATPFRRDLCAELAKAVRDDRLKLGWYFSPMDWRDPDFRTERNAVFLTRMQGELRELLSHYGRIDIMWFDYDGREAPYDQTNTYALVKKLQPQIIIDNRLDLGVKQGNTLMLNPNADYYTPEQRIGGYDDQRPWETCMTLGTQWSWKPNDQIKSAGEVISILARTVGGDGNLLLDVGPMPDGRIEPRQIAVLKQVGAWMKVNGESIYGTRGGPWEPTTAIASTRKGKTIYVHIMEWPEGPVRLPDIPAKIVGAKLLKGGKVQLKQAESGIEITVAPEKRGLNDTVVVLKLSSDALKIPAVATPPAPAQSAK